MCDDAVIELKRSPGTCCHEASCDYAGFDYSVCEGCGTRCEECIKYKHIMEGMI